MTQPASLQDRLTIAIAAVAAACRVTRHVQNRQQHIERHSKDDMSPVTVADYAAQAVIARHLVDAFGTLTLVGEEDASTLREAGHAALCEAVAAAARVVWTAAGPAGRAGRSWACRPKSRPPKPPCWSRCSVRRR